MNGFRTKAAVTLGSLAALTAFVIAPNVASSKGKPGLKSFHGKVSDLAAGNDGFSIKRANGSTVDFAVNDNTVYRHVGGGFKALTVGEAVEVKAKKAGDPKVAKKVEAEGADGRNASGNVIDDHGNDGAGHNAGDDHGSGGHGGDDGANHNAGDDHGGAGQGTDDGANHNAGNDKGSGGKGADDGATHNAGDDHGSGKHGGDNAGGHGHGSDG